MNYTTPPHRPFSKKIETVVRILGKNKETYTYTAEVLNLLDDFMHRNLPKIYNDIYDSKISPLLNNALDDAGHNNYKSVLKQVESVELFASKTIPNKLYGIGDGCLSFNFIPLSPDIDIAMFDPLIVVEGADKKRFVLKSYLVNPFLETDDDNLPYSRGD